MNRLNYGSLRGFISRLAACAAVLLLLSVVLTPGVEAQNDEQEAVIFVLDLSGSMNEPFDDEQSKLEAAKAAFVEAFANVSPDALVGLRTYGDQFEAAAPAARETGCTSDTRLVAPVAPLQRTSLISEVEAFSALGDTPIGLALQEASGDVPDGATGTIVLFSDGRDECFDADLDGDATTGPSYGADPCEIARSIVNDSSGVDRVMTVGFATDDTAEAELRCIAESTGGAYTAIETPEDARDVLPELLVQLSAPREAQRQVGRSIRGTDDIETAPDLVRLNEIGAEQVLYTDTIEMNSERTYRMSDYGPGGGTLTATVFGLPAQSDITLDLRMVVPRLDEEFFEGEHGDIDAGLPSRSSASIRCTGCTVSNDRADEVFWIITLETENDEVEDAAFELEILTEGPGFGGPQTSCRAPQACFYPAEILQAQAELETLQATIDSASTDVAPEQLIAERDAIEAASTAAQEAVETTNLRAEELEARIATAPTQQTSWRLPMLMMALGAILALAPLSKLLRRDGDEEQGETESPAGEAAPAAAAPEAPAAPAPSEPATAQPGPTLDVEPAPAVSNDGGMGHDWNAELEAAKAALAQQRPLHPRNQPEEQAVVARPSAVEAMQSRQAELAGEAATAAAAAPEMVDAVAGATGDATIPAAVSAVSTVNAPAASPASGAIALGTGGAEPAAPVLPTTQDAPAEPASQGTPTEPASQDTPTEPASQGTPTEPASQDTAVQTASALVAGWYEDPADPSQYRWWDGNGWTEHTSKGEAS